MRRLIWLLFIGIVFLVVACNSPLFDLNLKKKVILEVTGATLVTFDSLLLEGVVYDLDQNAADVGFVWIDDVNAVPSRALNTGSVSLGGKDRNAANDFQVRAGRFKLDRTYVISAYSVVEGVAYYSDSIHFTIPNGQVTTLSYSYQGGRSITFAGQLEGTAAGMIANEHGFVWSSTNTEPTLSDNFVNLGVMRNDQPFFYTLENISNGSPIHIRAYGLLLYEGTESLVYGLSQTFDGNLLDFWEEITNVPPLLKGRDGATAFSIDGIGYIGLGRGENAYFKDFFSYDLSSQSWALVEEFPGPARKEASCFVLNGKAYVGFGISSNFTYLQDLYVFNPGSGWSPVLELGIWPGARAAAIFFSLDGKGYMGGGRNSGLNNLEDFWQFDPGSSTWTQLADCPGPERGNPVSFSINGKGYMGLGSRGNGEPLRDFWSYDPSTNSWSPLADFAGGLRSACASFVLNGEGYVFSGSTWTDFNGIYPKDVWAYDPSSNTWEEKRADGPLGRAYATAFSVGAQAVLGTGYRQDNQGQFDLLKDFWVYFAD